MEPENMNDADANIDLKILWSRQDDSEWLEET